MKDLSTVLTGLELSEKLFDNGCKLPATFYYIAMPNGTYELGIKLSKRAALIEDPYQCYTSLKDGSDHDVSEDYKDIPAFDILNDVCVKYREEFFGEDPYDKINQIFALVLAGKRDEAEESIWKNCLFNKRRKK